MNGKIASDKLCRYAHFVLLLVAVIGSVCGQYSMKVHLSSATSIEGDHLEVTCEVKSRQKKKPFFVLWIRRSHGEEVDIGTNGHVNDVFNRTGRYKAKYFLPLEEDYREVNFYLNINNLTSSDSGEIGCRIPDNVEILRPFTVIVPVASVRLMSRDLDNTHAVAYEDGQNVTFTEGDKRRFFCYVNGSYPQPEVKVIIGESDVTRLFDVSTELVKDGPKGLRAFYYKVELINQGLDIAYEYNHQTMTCTARDVDRVLPAKSASIAIHLSGHRPKFRCDHQFIATLYEPNLRVKCDVFSDPPITNASVHWKRLTENLNVTLTAGERDGHYTVKLLDGATVFEKTMTLIIDRAYPQVFRTYIFGADNDLGTGLHEIEVLQKGHSQPLRSCGHLVKLVLSSLTLMPAILLFLTVGW